MREAMLILHFIGLTMGLGTGFAHAFLGAATAKMTAEESTKFRLHTLVISKMGHIGLTLLLVSGLYLITPYWKTLSSTPLLMLKLSLVAVLIVIITLLSLSAKRAKQGNAELEFKKMEKFGKMTLLIGLAIIVIAVLIFH